MKKLKLGFLLLIPLIFLHCVFHQSDRENPIYSPGKQFIFKTHCTNETGDVLHADTLKLSVEDESFMIVQQKIAWYLKMPLNDSGTKEVFEYTGVVEKQERLWIHPPRSEYVKITELAPFPEVRFPVKQDEEWESSLYIGPGYGDWSGKKVENDYRISRFADTSFNDLTFRDCTVIEATGKSEPGETKVYHWFHDEYGFVLMDYYLPEEERLTISLTALPQTENDK